MKKPLVKLIQTALLVALLCVGARLSIPLPEPLSPISLQWLAALLAVPVMGGAGAAAGMFIYAAMGLLGLPIFTAGGGLAYVLRPWFGFVPGMAIGLLAVTKFRPKNFRGWFLRFLTASLIMHAVALIYFCLVGGLVAGVDISFTISGTFLLTILPGDIVKCVVAAGVAPRLAVLKKTNG